MTHPLNAFFDKIFIISIQRNQERLKVFQTNNPDLEVEVYEGIDGKQLFPSIERVANFPESFFLEHQLSYDRCKIWNKGQLGCAMSNLLVQKEIIKRNLQKVLILEDDACIVKDKISLFNNALKELPPDWDLFYLGYSAPSKFSEHSFPRFFLKIKHFFRPYTTNGMSSGDLKKRYFSAPYSKHLKLPGVYSGTHAYALSQQGAKKIIDIDTPLQFGFDMTLMYANYHKLVKGYALQKPLFVPNSDFVTTLIN